MCERERAVFTILRLLFVQLKVVKTAPVPDEADDCCDVCNHQEHLSLESGGVAGCCQFNIDFVMHQPAGGL